MPSPFVVSVIVGLLAGFLDSIAGGGGLITLPFLTLLLGDPVEAIGTNKIVGTMGALTAFLIYRKHSHQKLEYKEGLLFSLVVALGSFIGSLLTPYFPKSFFVYLIVISAPVILYVIFKKDFFVTQLSHAKPKKRFFFLAALACGIYDGSFGPGGGTFMLLALIAVVRMPVFKALALSKLANTFSAGTALVSFYYRGHVHIKEGLMLGSAMLVGATLGANSARKWDLHIIRPMLAIAVTLLLLTLIFKH